MIVPSARFSCNGRITNITVSQFQLLVLGSNFPLFQVWHPTSLNSTIYNKIGEIQLPAGDFVAVGVNRNYFSASVSLNSNSLIEFQSGDVIGYYQPSDPRALIGSIQTSGYTSYSNSVNSPLTSIDINDTDNTDTDHQPLIAVIFGNIYNIRTYIYIASYNVLNTCTYV